MTIVPRHLLPLIDAYRTCELLTVGRDGTPIAWPTVPVYRPDDGVFLITTSIALPQKAYNIRRDPRVALLFSDPAGSGLTAPEQILIQGSAVCPDEILTSARPIADFWARIGERQPSSRMYRQWPMRRFTDWYYMRLLITVTPEAVRSRPPLDATTPLPASRPAPRLAQFTSAVLAGYDTAGRPTLQRVRPADAGGALAFETDGDLRPGPASLLCHSHDDQLDRLRSFALAGELGGEGRQWRLTPRRLIPGADGLGPVEVVRTIRGLRRVADRYLRRRGLDRPGVPWAEYQDLAEPVAAGGYGRAS